jgi:hypothetical protein
LFQLVVLCFCTTPGATSVVVFFWTTAPLPGMVVVVVCDVVAGTTGGLTWTTGGGASTVFDSTVLLKHPAPINAAPTVKADITIPGRSI